MRIYPDLPLARVRAVALDTLVLLLLLVCLLTGRAVHAAVSELDVLGRGVEDAGGQVEEAFQDAGGRVEDAPVVGKRIDKALSGAGSRTGEPVQRAGRRGRAAVADLADLLGWLVGGLPALVIVATWLPGRMRRARTLLAARRVFAGGIDDERRRLLAMRAAFSLPFEDLVRETRDPIGDLAQGRLEPLLAALGSAHGLRVPQASPRPRSA